MVDQPQLMFCDNYNARNSINPFIPSVNIDLALSKAEEYRDLRSIDTVPHHRAPLFEE